ncbi:[FeFe] hydrogenase H-cluster maturation GTPase HydF [bacterium 1XD8-76]|nr:[FeFe] hydrogenase H-cluster maturation GTPase HydF [bacterium 1XD8-76]
MNQTPAGERVHIAFFGRRNVGKSSLMNAFTGQDLSVVSPVEGTTTDAVYKAMELWPLGPVVLIDTPGLDDTGELGEKRVQKAKQVMQKADIAIVVAEAASPPQAAERKLILEFERKGIPWLLVYNKEDLARELPAEQKEDLPERGMDDKRTLRVSAKTGFHIRELKERVAALLPGETVEKPLIGDLLSRGDTVVLVVPIDAGAPKGRLILPQQQVIRGVLEAGASALVCRDSELEETLQKLVSPPRLVVTDSQVFDRVGRIVPESVPLTSFSILMARYKGDLAQLAEGAKAVERLGDGDRVLICEGCTHHRQCEDIGTVKIPNLIRRYTGNQQNVCEPEFSFTSGTEFPTDVSSYKLVVHCGGCMLNRREMQYRLERCREQGVPVTNYGVLIARLNGILERAVGIFKSV